MASLNRVVLIGNLTRDPELRVTPNGNSVATIGLAVGRRRSSADGANNTDFFNIVAWQRLAELCQEYLKKGSPIAVDGRLQYRSWETAEGQKRSTVEVVAENIQFLGRPSRDHQEQESGFTAPQKHNDLETEEGVFSDEVPF